MAFENMFSPRFWANSLLTKKRTYQKKRLQVKIAKILAATKKPIQIDSEDIFDNLQRAYSPLPEYGYDFFQTWRRGMGRAIKLLEQFQEIRTPKKTVMDVACGDGMTGWSFAQYGHEVILSDLEDWRDERAKKISMIVGDVCAGFDIAGDYFDLICSYNAFEHIDNPLSALTELIRICKPGGIIYLEFGPLYPSPWGLHAFQTIYIPYSQYLFTEDLLKRKFTEFGIQDLGMKRDSLQPLNKWRLMQFNEIWENSNCEIVAKFTYQDDSHLNLITCFPTAFRGYSLTFDDVVTQAIYITLRKPL